MKKKILLLITVFSLTIIMCFYFRSKVVFVTFDERLSQTPYVQIEDLYYGFSKEKELVEYQADYTATHSLEQLIKKSDLIAKIHFKSRQQKISVIETIVDVKEVYKGNKSQTITIYEPGYTAYFYSFLSTHSSTHFIKDDYDYIVFLQNALPENNNYYNYVNTLYSLYPVKDKILTKQLEYTEGDEDLQITMSQYNQYDQFFVKYKGVEDEETKKAIEQYYKQYEEYPTIAKQVYKQYLNQNIEFVIE